MRLFVALRPPAAALDHASAAVGPVRRAEPGPRWVPPERWHLTLAFYGDVDDSEAERLRRRLGRVLAGVPPMSLVLAGAGAFRRRAVWLGVAGDVDALRATAAAVDRDHRPYRPHLTVARLRGETDPAGAVAALSTYAGPPWTATEVHLVRSHLGPDPRHEDLASVRLQ